MRSRGFTLIELLVALAILAIISAIAIPIYTQYSVRTQRTNAEKDLMMCAQSMERLNAQSFTYAGLVGPGADTGAVTPNICTPTSTGMYAITVTVANANTFTLRATPIAGTAVDTQPNKGGGMLEVDASGATRWDRNIDGNFGDADE